MSDKTPRLAVAQIGTHVGDIEDNVRRILEAVEEAKDQGADLLVTPEMALSGNSPKDLLFRQGFPAAVAAGLDALIEAVADITLVVGHPEYQRGVIYNAAAVIQGGRVVARYRKQYLQDQGALREHRYYQAGDQCCVFELHGRRIGLMLGSEAQQDRLMARYREAGAELILNLDATPFYRGRPLSQEVRLSDRVQNQALPICCCNAAGAQDALVFEGRSVALSADGAMAMRAPMFSAGVHCLDWQDEALEGEIHALPSAEAQVYDALVWATRDYINTNGFPGALIGVSGGIDSALTLAIAADALGGERVWAVSMPSRYTADISNVDAADQAERLGVHYNEASIEAGFASMLETLAPLFGERQPNTAEENLQARLRGDLLMSLSNKFGNVVLVPGNKSEMAVGYTTLYGDMCGGYAPLKDVYKTWVYRLARFRNQRSKVIPERVITRAPSAELRADQADSDSLPDYAQLDPIIEAWVEQNDSIADIIRKGHAAEDVRLAVRLMRGAEYKRQQAPIGPKVTGYAFGTDRDYPITVDYGAL